MIIVLKQLFNIIGERKDIDYYIPIEELSSVSGYNFISPVHVKGEIFNKTGIVHLNYSVDFTLKIICDRCLKELDRDYHFDFEHIVVGSADCSNDEYIVADGESIDLNDLAVSDLLLQCPTKFLCDEECKGLCMICGCDLNESECDCLK